MKRRWSIRLVTAAVVCAAAYPALATERHVPGEYGTIQAAIDDCANDDTVIVADGTYTGVSDRDLNLRGKSILVRSANGPASCILDCQQAGAGFIFSMGASSGGGVDGFTIHNAVPGFLCSVGGPTIQNCIVSGGTNGAVVNGGSPRFRTCTFSGSFASGVTCSGFGTPVFEQCTISDNHAQNGAGVCFASGFGVVVFQGCTISGNHAVSADPQYGLGGGVYNGTGGGHPLFTNCIIADNTANWGGGAWGHAYLTNCTIRGNAAEYGGGGAYCEPSGTPQMTNCLIVGNRARSYGGGAYVGPGVFLLYNCIMAGNVADFYGGGIYVYDHSSVQAWNTIFSQNVALHGSDAALDYSSQLYLNYCDVPAGAAGVWFSGGSYAVWGAGTIVADPRFVNAASGDFRLQLDSPCVDAGSGAGVGRDDCDLDHDGEHGEFVPYDFAGNPRISRFVVDMGAYEIPFGDLNCDRSIDYGDINPFVVALSGQTRYEAQYPGCTWLYADLNGDGVVSYGDINPFVRLLSGS